MKLLEKQESERSGLIAELEADSSTSHRCHFLISELFLLCVWPIKWTLINLYLNYEPQYVLKGIFLPIFHQNSQIIICLFSFLLKHPKNDLFTYIFYENPLQFFPSISSIPGPKLQWWRIHDGCLEEQKSPSGKSGVSARTASRRAGLLCSL